jgi:hypothetical protein
MKNQFDRRSLLKLGAKGAVGAIGLEQLLGIPLVGDYIDHWPSSRLAHLLGVNPYDAFQMMDLAWRGGLGVPFARAQSTPAGWSLVQIKVCNHVFTPLVFKLGQLNQDNTVTIDTAGGMKLGSEKMGGAKDFLIAKGLDLISDNERWRNLRFNKWFADILQNGTADGATAQTSTNSRGLSLTDIESLSSEKVAVQTFLGLGQIAMINHALKGCKVREDQSDITLLAQSTGLIKSPLGITCFMMGEAYDQAEGSISRNAVLGKDRGEVVVVNSRSVQAYVSQISQFVGKSYADRQPLEQNVIYKMDQIVQRDPKLRRDLVDSIAQFQAGMTNLQAAASLEKTRQSLQPGQANTQNLNKQMVGAASEFLGQCKYVVTSLDLPGNPVRNFSLFLNATDLDGRTADIANDGGGGNPAVQALSYVEAMRQLGMGLNVLAKAIASGKKMVVVVHSEGGRDVNMKDSKRSFAIVLGPKGSGMLDDQLYANKAMINQTKNPIIADPASPEAAVPWDVDGLKEADGSAAASTVVPNTGDVQLGVIEFLESQTGVKARTGFTGPDGRFVKLKRTS